MREEVENQKQADQSFEDVLRVSVEECPEFQLQYESPSWKNILLSQLFLLPCGLFWRLYMALIKLIKYRILNKELDENDKLDLTCQALGVQPIFFQSQCLNDQQYYLDLELWRPKNFRDYNEALRVEERQKAAESGRAKSFKRFMKSGGYGRMTFEE